MSIVRKIVLVITALFLGLTETFVYMNNHLFYKSAKQEGVQRISSLEKSNRYFPLNDQSSYELGKTYLDLAVQNPSDPVAAETAIRKSIANFAKAIRINPASAYSHFYLGQALLKLGVLSPRETPEFLGEFRRAVQLAGEDPQILNEVGCQFLSRWGELSHSDRVFTLEMIRKIAAKRDEAQLALVLNSWLIDAQDYDILDQTLPTDARTYRYYARFLGERSLSLEVRQKYLTMADTLDFTKAKREFQAGELRLLRLQVGDALSHFQGTLNLTRSIKFYQALTSQDSIGEAEYSDLLKFTLLDLAKCRIEQRAKLTDVEADLLQYLALEKVIPNVSELDGYLRDRGVLPEKFDGSVEDLRRLSFELTLLFKQTRYREIVDFGRSLDQKLLVVPEAQRPDYVRILNIVGDSLQKTDFLYDASDIFQKAKDIDPQNLATLVRIRENCKRLNDDGRKLKNEQDIEKVISPRETNYSNAFLAKGQGDPIRLIFDGSKIVLDLAFGENKEGAVPLIAVFFNGRVVWEDYLKKSAISLSLETKIGQNELEIIPVNRPVTLAKLTYRMSEVGVNPDSRRLK